MRVLALDMATNCGWAYRAADGSVVSGVEDFAKGCPKGGDTICHPHLLLNARSLIQRLALASGADVVMIESGFMRGRAATFLLQRLIGVAMTVAQEANAAVLSVGPDTWRKAIHGSGGFDTDAAKALATARTGIADDNEAEAVCILEYTERLAISSPAPVKRRKAA